MESNNRQEECKSVVNNNFERKKSQACIENLFTKSTNLSSSHTNGQDTFIHNIHNVSNIITPVFPIDDSSLYKDEKFRLCVENNRVKPTIAKKSPNIKIPCNVKNRNGAISVLPFEHSSRKVNNCHALPNITVDQFSRGNSNYCERSADLLPSFNDMTTAINNSNILSMKPGKSFDVAYAAEDLLSALNTARQNLKPVEKHCSKPTISSQTSQHLNASQNDLTGNVSTLTEETSIGKQRMKDIANVDSDSRQSHEIAITSHAKDSFGEARYNEQKIKDTLARSFLSGNRKDTLRIEPCYESIEDENENEFQIEDKQKQIMPEMNAYKKVETKRIFGSIQNLFQKMDKLQETDSSDIQRSESFPKTYRDSPNKVEENGHDDDADKNNFDKMWINYADRPLLPLKLTQKQRSLSCTSLVQTIKGFSKRNSADNNRFLSVETTGNSVAQSKEIFVSEANISKDCTTKISPLQGFKPQNGDVIFGASSAKSYPWYHEVDAKEASKRLLFMQQDGVFLIRPASNPTKYIHYTLCVTYDFCVYNMYVRKLKNGLIALGKQKEHEMTFSSILEMIRYHQVVPISINLEQAGKTGKVYLLITPPK